MKKSSDTTNPDSVLESNLALYNAKWNLPKAADHCGMTKREMKMTFREFIKYNPPLEWKESNEICNG
jgi:hypothetical protein